MPNERSPLLRRGKRSPETRASLTGYGQQGQQRDRPRRDHAGQDSAGFQPPLSSFLWPETVSQPSQVSGRTPPGSAPRELSWQLRQCGPRCRFSPGHRARVVPRLPPAPHRASLRPRQGHGTQRCGAGAAKWPRNHVESQACPPAGSPPPVPATPHPTPGALGTRRAGAGRERLSLPAPAPSLAAVPHQP